MWTIRSLKYVNFLINEALCSHPESKNLRMITIAVPHIAIIIQQCRGGDDTMNVLRCVNWALSIRFPWFYSTC